MELLLALDFVNVDEAQSILRELRDCIDIVEVGTPFIVKEGLRAVTTIKREFPGLRVMADLKIMDAGEYETRAAVGAGADIVTVLGVAHNETIRAAVAAARELSGSIMVDMIGVREASRRAREIDGLGADFLCVHTAADLRGGGQNPLDELRRIKESVHRARLAVAGGITLDSLEGIADLAPDIVIVGGGITGQRDRRKAAVELSRFVRGGER